MIKGEFNPPILQLNDFSLFCNYVRYMIFNCRALMIVSFEQLIANTFFIESETNSICFLLPATSNYYCYNKRWNLSQGTCRNIKQHKQRLTLLIMRKTSKWTKSRISAHFNYLLIMSKFIMQYQFVIKDYKQLIDLKFYMNKSFKIIDYLS